MNNVGDTKWCPFWTVLAEVPIMPGPTGTSANTEVPSVHFGFVPIAKPDQNRGQEPVQPRPCEVCIFRTKNDNQNPIKTNACTIRERISSISIHWGTYFENENNKSPKTR